MAKKVTKNSTSQLPGKEGLCVPVSVLALSVSKTDPKGLIGPSADFSQLPFPDSSENIPYLSDKVVGSPFTGMQKQAGIHLHWILPDALTTATWTDEEKDEKEEKEEKEGKFEFPPVPNRWLVERRRIFKQTDGTEVSEQVYWVVESDYRSESGGQENITVPVDIESETENKPFKFMGRKTNYADWQAESAASNNTGPGFPHKLTAVGYGEPLFSSFHSNSKSCFGLYEKPDELDKLDGIEEVFSTDSGSLSYAVVGWFAEGEHDPLNPLNPKHYGTLQECLDAHQWELPEKYEGDVGYTLYHGSVRNIPWNEQSQSGQNKTHPTDEDLHVAVGSNSIETLSALTARLSGQGGKQDADQEADIERILNALQLGLLSSKNHEHLDIEELTDALHQSGFISSASQKLWSINAKVKSSNLPPIPLDVAQTLDELNQFQATHDLEHQKLNSLRSQLFLDYWRWMYLKYPGLKPSKKIKDLRRHIESLKYRLADTVDNVSDHVNALENIADSIKTKRNELIGELGNKYSVTQDAAPRFWGPGDPVVLLAGPAAKPSEHFGDDGRFTASGHLRCRLSNQVISKLSFKREDASIIEWGEGLLPKLAATGKLPHAETILRLLSEDYMLDGSSVPFLLSQQQQEPMPTQPEIEAILDLLAKSLDAASPADKRLCFDGELPSQVAHHDWEEEWNPIMLQWEVHYKPVVDFADKGVAYSRDWIAEDYELVDGELVYKKPDVLPGQLYSGYTILTPGARSSLKFQLSEFIKHDPSVDPDGELKKLLDQIGDIPILSQSLDGMSESMLMKWPQLQMDIKDPMGHDHSFIEEIKDAVANENTHQPKMNNNYNPIRTGLCQITRLWLVDSFGQYKPVGPTEWIFAQSIKQPDSLDKHDPNENFFLPPRLVQKSRLHFRWLHADSNIQSNSHPGTSPVCGWLFPNYFDSSLMIYDPDGEALGALILGGDTSRVFWHNAPGGSDPDAEMNAVLQGRNEHFVKVIRWIYNGGDSTNFLAMQAIIEEATINMDPDHHHEATVESLMIGKPLAVTRAHLDMELESLPAINQGWDDFEDYISTEKNGNEGSTPDYSSYMNRNRCDFTRVNFPVMLGNQARGNDGHVGYFLNNQYDNFFSDQAIPVNLEPGSDACELTLLVNPRFKVHAYTGILPVKDIDIPPSLYEPVLDRLNITFFNSPLLMNVEEPAMALPNIKTAFWSWLERQDEGWSNYPDDLNAGKKSDETRRIGDVDEKEHKSVQPLSIREGWLKLKRK